MTSIKGQRFVVVGVTIGGLLEWYEMFLYIYWAPIISKLFFNSSSEIIGLINTLLIFAIGFLSRPLGGLIFGHIGDRWGRRTSFIISVVSVTFPTFLIAVLPPYSAWGPVSVILLGITRFIQGIPAGGELPGSMCYLAECSPPEHKRFMCSFSFVGPQIGGIIGMIECFLFEAFISHENLITWGWRLSFIIGGLLGLLGFFLRRKLTESPVFKKLQERHETLRYPIFDSFSRQKKKMFFAFLLSILEVVGYFMIAIFPAVYFEKIFRINASVNLMIIASLLMLSALTIPIAGWLADKYKKTRSFLIISAVGVIALSYPLYLAIHNASLFATIVVEIFLVFFLNFQFALLPSLLSDLFPAPVRYTCLGFSFNLCDSIVGGLTPAFALYLIHLTGDVGIFSAIFAIAAFISLIAFLSLTEKKFRISYEQGKS